MINFSILLPTRRRPSLVYKLFESIVKTTHDIQSVEIVLYMDADDTASHNIDMPALKIVKIIKPPGNSMGMMFKECYKKSSGRYIILMNDDVVFSSVGWDKAVVNAFSKFSDDIVFVYGNDLDQGERSPTIPILSRKACELMGGICPEGYLNLHIESHLLDTFKQLKRFGHDRIVYLNDVIFEHLHYTVGKSKHDNTYIKKDPGFDDRLFIALDGDRRFTAMKLAKSIEGCKNGLIGSSEKNINKQWISDERPNPVISVVVPVFYDNIKIFVPCLDAIINESNGKTPFEVIIVGVGSNDKINTYLLNLVLLGKIRIVYSREESNFAILCNQGAKESKGDYIVFLKGGNVPESGWIDALVAAAKMNNEIAVVGCKLLNHRNGRIQHAGICFFDDRGRLKSTYIYRGFNADNPFVNRLREFQAISSDCMLVKKDVFLNVGGFDENLHDGEDIDLCLRIREQGMKVIYTPEPILYHYQDVSFGEGNNYSHNSFVLPSKWAERIKFDLDRFLQEDGFSPHKKDNAIYISMDKETITYD